MVFCPKASNIVRYSHIFTIFAGKYDLKHEKKNGLTTTGFNLYLYLYKCGYTI